MRSNLIHEEYSSDNSLTDNGGAKCISGMTKNMNSLLK